MSLTQTGWMDVHAKPKDYVASLLEKTLPYSDVHTLAIGSRGRNNFFAAILDDSNGYIFMEHIELQIDKTTLKDGKVKVTSIITRENELAKEFRCPSFILSLLTPVEKIQEIMGEMNWSKNYSGKWREQAIEKAKRIRENPKSQPISGDIIEFEEPLYYRLGELAVTRFIVSNFNSPGTLSLGQFINGHLCPYPKDSPLVAKWYTKPYRIITLSCDEGQSIYAAKDVD